MNLLKYRLKYNFSVSLMGFGQDFRRLEKCFNNSIVIKGIFGGACGIMVIIVGIGHGDTSSNPGRD